jgi:hypothetical protein
MLGFPVNIYVVFGDQDPSLLKSVGINVNISTDFAYNYLWDGVH